MSISRRTCLRTGPVFLALAPAACASRPTSYYRLAAIPGTPRTGTSNTIGVRSISLPGYLDQSGIAKTGPAYQYAVFGDALWADSLADMLQDSLVQELAQRLPSSTVVGSGGSIGITADQLVEINVLRFDPDDAGHIVLSAQVQIKSGPQRTPSSTQNFTSTAAPAGPDAASIVATMSTLWGGLADGIANLIVQSSQNTP